MLIFLAGMITGILLVYIFSSRTSHKVKIDTNFVDGFVAGQTIAEEYDVIE